MMESSLFRVIVAECATQGFENGYEKGYEKGQAKAFRFTIMTLLEQKFGSIPADLDARIQATTDNMKLQAAIRQLLPLNSPNDLIL